ncbi:MarR family winged helix-turn-helix transcriptional regulator [Hymenobacter weizhouensis]|uniref:MarR family winged helix-turn-helix transcriptional regulator n=1 Tax=Hymenobacter sp. YIM 151500-1 TaxID=2987689 RepID=UPI002226ABD2|nr:MarR family transcriptional regulator [Hymenobacter sp. YIM 151500-1]UYZ61780.1 MarR family transcriptional regulator [Hymenobacter sp. YIM 151500-1]
MARDYTLLHTILDHLADYEGSTPEPTAAGFGAWLHAHTAPPEPGAELPYHAHPAYLNHMPPTHQLGPLLVRLSHFYHFHAQQALANLPITSIREFGVMAAIGFQGTHTKSEVAALNLLELSTVTEVTRRLVQAGLLQETPDATDRRVRRLYLTPTGQAALEQATTRMEQLTTQLFSPLPPPDQLQLLRLLSPLNDIHTTQFFSQK